MKKTLATLLIVSVVFSGALTSVGQSGTGQVRPAIVAPVTTGEGELVQFDRIDALSDGDGVLVRWSTRVETGIIGFNGYRVGGAEPELVNDGIVVSASLLSNNHSTPGHTHDDRYYELFDPNGSTGTAYQIKALGQDGSATNSSSFVPRPVRDLEAEAGRSRESLLATALHLNSRIASRDLQLPTELRAIVAAGLREPDLETQQWVASQPGAKIAVSKDGLYRVTRQQLMEAGFDLSVNPANWRLFMNGIEQAIIVDPQGLYIEFIGKAIDTRESDTSIYYLIADDVAGRRMTSKILRPIGGTVISNNYRVTAAHHENFNFIPDIINGELDNYFGRVINHEPASVSFVVTAMDTTLPRQMLTISLLALQGTTHNVRVVLNGHDVGYVGGTLRGVYQTYSADLLVPSDFFVEGTNVLTLTETMTQRSNLFDSVSVQYSRKYQAEQNTASFYTPGLRKVDVTGFTSSDVRMFDTTLDASPVEISNLNIVSEGGTFAVKLPSSRAMVMYGVIESAILQSTTVTANTPSTLSTATNVGEFLIISDPAPDFISESETWANYRRSSAGGGVTAKVVDVTDIYDEFSYGVHSAAAINSFLRYASNNWTTPPRYVLLMGDASSDPRNYEGSGFFDRVPTSMVPLIFEESGSDDALADFDHDGLAEMAIGRIPVRNAGDIAPILDKTKRFELPELQSLDRGALFAYDRPEDHEAATGLANELPASVPKFFVGRYLSPPNPPSPDPNAQANLINDINRGRYIVNYSGHAATGVWAGQTFFSLNNVPSLTNAGRESIFTALKCYSGRFFRPQTDSLSEALIKTPNGGAVAYWAPTTETLPVNETVIGRRFYNQIGIREIKRMGDLVRDAKLQLAGSDVPYSWVLMGDPMLRVTNDAVR